MNPIRSSRPMLPPELATATATLSPRLRRSLLIGYACLIIYVSLYPFTGWHAAINGWWSFDPSVYRHISRSDVLANVLLYLPFGFLFALRRGLRALPLILVAAFAISLGVETTQACIPGRVSSALDLGTNVIGAALGAVAATSLRWPGFVGGRFLMARVQTDRIAWLGVAALVAWTSAQLIPFVPSIDVSTLRHGLRLLWYALHGTQPIRGWRIFVYVVATASLTVCGAAALRTARANLPAAWLLAVLPIKVLVIGRQLSAEALVGTAVGVAVGIAAWTISRSRALAGAAILIPIYVIAAALEPGPPGTVVHAFNWIPLGAQMTQPLNGLANLADQVWPWLALACLCLRLGLRPLWALLPLIVLLLVAVEWAQCVIPGRYPGITPILAGAVAWIVAAAYADRRPAHGS